MESFTVIKNQTDDLYHGTNIDKDKFIIQDKPIWLAHSANNSNKYGKNVFKYKLRREVKLIDISNQLFHLDFISKVNNETELISTEKFLPLVALGLPDLTSQMNTLDKKFVNGNYPHNNIIDKKLIEAIDKFVSLFGNKHRYSFNGNNIQSDILLVKALIKHYPSFDGYTCKNYWPSYHHSGFFIPETCLFKPQTIIEQDNAFKGGKIKKQSNKKTKQHAGTGTNQNSNRPIGAIPNDFGGYFYTIEQYCKDTDTNFEDLIRTGIRE
jgi:hypothetical protein